MALKRVRKKVNPKKMLDKKRSYVDTVQEELELKGVDFFEPSDKGSLNIDTDFLILPKNITEVQARDLGEYLNAYTQQKMYMRTLMGWAECLMEETKREYYVASEKLYTELSKSKLSETAKERLINSDEDIKPFYIKYVDYKKKVQLLDLNLSSIEDAIFLISREVSRRTGDFNTENRNYNVSIT